MIKKLLACLLVCSLLLSTCAFAAVVTDVDESTNPEAVNYLVDLGVLTTVKDEFLPSQTMTRAEYVDAVLRLIGVETGEYGGNGNHDIYDVTEYMEYYSAVLFALDMGLVAGNGDGTFRPKEVISVADAVVILVRALGYDPLAQDAGGYVAGYVSRANRLDLLMGVTVSGELTHDICAQLFYNALEVEILKAVSYGSDSVILRTVEGETVLSEYHSIQQITGLVTEQVYDVHEENAEGFIRMDDGTVLDYDGTEDLVGERLEIHYRENKATGRKTVFRILGDPTVKTVTLDAADVVYKNLTYTDEDNKAVKIGKLTRVFYNGKEMDPFDEDLLDPSVGTIKLTDYSGGYYQVAKITSYQDYLVEAVNTDKQVVYDRSGADKSFPYEGVNALVVNGGTVVSLETVSKNTVLSVAMSQDGQKARIFINSAKTEGIIQRLAVDSFGDSCYLTVGEDTVTYPIAPALATKMTTDVQPGETVIVYLNSFGYIAGYDVGASQSYVYGYLANSAVNEEGFSSNLAMKIFTQGGELVTYYTEGKIVLDGSDKTPAVDCYDKLGAGQLIRYIVNASGKIFNIDTAYSDTNPRGINESENSFQLFYTSDSSIYNNGSATLSGIAVVGTGTLKWLIPEDPKSADADEFEIGYTLSNNGEYKVSAYKNNADSFTADIVLCHSGSGGSTFSSGNRPLMINDVYQGLNEDGETVTYISGLRTGKAVTFEVKEGCTGTTQAGTDFDVAELEGGDIARILVDSKSRVKSIQVLWDRSKAESGSWVDGAQVTKNPTSSNYNLSGVRFLCGEVYATDGNYFKVRYIGSDVTSLEKMPTYLNSKCTFYVYGPHKDGSWFKKGTKADLLSYKLDPVNCSKVFIRQYYTATQVEVIIFNQ